jgi:putative sterol carrier protein
VAAVAGCSDGAELATARADSLRRMSRKAEFRVDGRVFEVRVEDATTTTSEGTANRPIAAFTMSTGTLDQLISGQLNAAQAIAGGSVQVSGDPEALARFQDLFPPFDFQAVGEQDESA